MFSSRNLETLSHKIDIYSSQVTIPQLNGDYEKGYDQLAYGLRMDQIVNDTKVGWLNSWTLLNNGNEICFEVIELNTGDLNPWVICISFIVKII